MIRSAHPFLLLPLLACLLGPLASASDAHDAATRGDVALLERIVDADPAALDRLDGKKRSPLFCAASGGRRDAVMFLLERGADKPGMAAVAAADSGHRELLLELLERGTPISEHNERGTTLLMIAASSGHAQICEDLLGRGADLEATNEDGRSALYYAALYDQPVTAQLLLDRSSPAGQVNLANQLRLVNQVTLKGWTPLHAAASKGHVRLVSLLLEAGAEVDVRATDGATPLIHAARTGRVGAARALLERGARLESPDRDGDTPLLNATLSLFDLSFEPPSKMDKDRARARMEMIRFLVASGADLLAKNRNGYSSATVATGKQRPEALKVLIAAGGDANAVHSGRTALILGIQSKDVELVELLISKGAGLSEDQNGHVAPLVAAAQTGVLRICELLLERGADPDERCAVYQVGASDDMLHTPIAAAAQKNSLPIVRMLVDRGVDVDVPGYGYRTALHHAASHGNVPMLRLLVENGAELNRLDEGRTGTGSGRTALTAAAASGHTSAVGYLLDQGANPDRSGKQGTLLAAVRNGHADVVRTLLRHGVSTSTRPGESFVLMVGVQSGEPDVVRVLLEARADRTDLDWVGSRRGYTPLMRAATDGRSEMVRLLVAAGARVDVTVTKETVKDAFGEVARNPEYGKTAPELVQALIFPDGYSISEDEQALDARWRQIAEVLTAATTPGAR